MQVKRLPREVTQPSSEEVFKIQWGPAQIALIHLTGPQAIPALSRRLEWRCPESLPVRVSTFKCVSTDTKPQDCACRLVLNSWTSGTQFYLLDRWYACICIHTAGWEAVPVMALAHFSVAGTATPCTLEGWSKH